MNHKQLGLTLLTLLSVYACGTNREREATISQLEAKTYTFEKAELPAIDQHQVIEQYRSFMDLTPTEPMYSEAMRRLADLELETSEQRSVAADQDESTQVDAAIRLYQTYLETYPQSAKNGMVLYQLARAYEINGEPEKAMQSLDQIVSEHGDFPLIDEVQFRRGEILFVLRDYAGANQAYGTITTDHPNSIFYEKALLKYGWTYFKQNRYTDSLNAFFQLLDRKYLQGKMLADGPAPDLSRSEEELLNDTLRVVSLAFSHLQGRESLRTYFSEQGQRAYEPLIYRHLGKLYLSKDRIHDAADTYLAFTQRFPNNPLSPHFYQEAIEAYKKGKFDSLVLPAKEKFVTLYGVDSRFWQLQSDESRAKVKPLLANHLRDLATHYHASARKDKKPATFQIAAQWYATYLKSFPDDPGAPGMNFLLAECLFDGQRFAEAISQYEKTAYQYPTHSQSAEAGYAALLSYREVEKRSKPQQLLPWRQQKIASALRFSESFADDKRVPPVLAKTAEELFELKQYAQASEVAMRLLNRNDVTDAKLKKTAWLVHAHSQFEMANYTESEKGYLAVLPYYPSKGKQTVAIQDRLAASVYKFAEQQRAQGNLAAAAHHFQRVKQVVPNSKLVATAEYDAATALIQMKDWPAASNVLEGFRKRFPKHQLQAGVTEKLALVYSQSGQGVKAAGEMEKLALNSKDKAYRQEMIWQAATLYQEGGKQKQAMRLYEQYVKEFPRQLPESMEGRHYLAEYYKNQRDAKRWGYWLREIIKADYAAGNQRTDRTRTLAAQATLTLAKPRLTEYQKVKLKIPLKKSLKKKKASMEKAIKAYQRAIDYQVADVTTSATYQIAEVYNDFARALMKSQRPKGLSADELEQYDLLLEEQAFPFEEKAIDIHAANMSYAADGIYDQWVKKSHQQLIKLQPVRYAKPEKVDSHADAIY